MNEDFFLKFGKKLRKERESKGLTQESLALSIDVDKSYIGRIERAERFPNIKIIVNIANILEIPVKDLFNFENL
jgi:transcriptional regulator with XRE-family HTH domain